MCVSLELFLDARLTAKLGVVHVPSFFKELESLKAKGLNPDDRVFISDRGRQFLSIDHSTILHL